MIDLRDVVFHERQLTHDAGFYVLAWSTDWVSDFGHGYTLDKVPSCRTESARLSLG